MEVLSHKTGLKFYYLKIDKKMKIIDSLQFLKSSLEKLVINHLNDNKPLKFTTKILETQNIKKDSELYALLTSQKSKFPYDYITNFDKLKETQLPPKSAFFNSLRQSNISDGDYCNAQKIFTLSGCKNLGDFMCVAIFFIMSIS